MLLTIDVGTTNITLGVYREARLLNTWRAATVRERTGDEHAALLQGLLALNGLMFDDLRGVAISSVVPALRPALRDFTACYLPCEAHFVGETLVPSMPIRYSPASAVGADRLVDAVAAVQGYGAPVIVVDCGTATTFDAVSASGEYLGGAILPGARLALDALLAAAPHHPRPALSAPPRAIGGSTAESMQSGTYYGFIGQVEGLVRRFRAELGPGTPVVATGGLAGVIADATAAIDHVEPFLTLEGLRLLWEAHVGSGRALEAVA